MSQNKPKAHMTEANRLIKLAKNSFSSGARSIHDASARMDQAMREADGMSQRHSTDYQILERENANHKNLLQQCNAETDHALDSYIASVHQRIQGHPQVRSFERIDKATREKWDFLWNGVEKCFKLLCRIQRRRDRSESENSTICRRNLTE